VAPEIPGQDAREVWHRLPRPLPPPPLLVWEGGRGREGGREGGRVRKREGGRERVRVRVRVRESERVRE